MCRATVGVAALPARSPSCGGRPAGEAVEGGGRWGRAHHPPTPAPARSAPTGPVPHSRCVPHSARAAYPPPRLAPAAAASPSPPQPTGLRVTSGRAHDTGEHGRGIAPRRPWVAKGSAHHRQAGGMPVKRDTGPPLALHEEGRPRHGPCHIFLPRNNKAAWVSTPTCRGAREGDRAA